MTKEKKIVIQTLESFNKEVEKIYNKYIEDTSALYDDDFVFGKADSLEDILALLKEKIRKIKEVK